MQKLISFTVNGAKVVLPANPSRRLLDVIREDLGLTGTKEGCGNGNCGSCLVLVDGKPLLSCLTRVQKVAGKNVITIEGLGSPGNPHPLQKAFVEAGAIQCGFCTPGIILAAKRLLDCNPEPTREEILRALSGNLCRCTGYKKIIEAVRVAAELMAAKTEPVYRAKQTEHPGYAQHMARATGTEKFAADYSIPGALHVKILRSPYAHAVITKIDTAGARNLSGVEAVITAGDIPGINLVGRIHRDQPVLAGSRVRHVGEAVAAVAAVSEDIARKALKQIVVEYEVLEAVKSPEAALAAGAPKIHENGNELKPRFELERICKGNIDEGFSGAAAVAEGFYSTPFQEHAYMETEAGVSHFNDEGQLVIYCCTQSPHEDRSQIAPVLGLDEERIRIIQAPTGGGFGGKLGISVQGILGLLTQKTGKPMKLVFNRTESFLASTKRHPFKISIRLGATKDGKLTALTAEMVADTGAYADIGPAVIVNAMIHATGPYEIPHAWIKGKLVYTNNPVAGAMRGFGVPQVTFAVESQMDLLAAKLGIDPFEFRLRNILNRASKTGTGQILTSCSGLEAVLEAIRPHYYTAMERNLRKRKRSGNPGPPLKRGLGLSCIWFGLGKGGLADPSEIVLELRQDGKILLLSGAADMGQGTKSTLAMIAAKTLGISPETIIVSTADTSITAFAGATLGSRQTFFSGNATLRAAESLKCALLAAAAQHWHARPEELQFQNGYVTFKKGKSRFPLSLADLFILLKREGFPGRHRGEFRQDVTSLDKDGQGRPFQAYHFAAHIAEVDVNLNSGEVRVIRLVAAHDVGKAIDLKAVEGQIEGGSLMGLGFALMEEYLPEGPYNLAHYKIPRITAAPEIIPIIIESKEPGGPLGAKGLGETPLVAAGAAIVNAVSNACGFPIKELPATPERILKALKDYN